MVASLLSANPSGSLGSGQEAVASVLRLGFSPRCKLVRDPLNLACDSESSSGSPASMAALR